jgi:hypothetical protein
MITIKTNRSWHHIVHEKNTVTHGTRIQRNMDINTAKHVQKTIEQGQKYSKTWT